MTVTVENVAACVGRIVRRGERLPSAVRRALGPTYRPRFVEGTAAAVIAGYVVIGEDGRFDIGPVAPPKAKGSPNRSSWRVQIEERIAALEARR